MRNADTRGIAKGVCGWTVVVVACLLLAAPLAAQEEGQMPEMSPEEQAMMQAWMAAGTPGEQHAELAKHAGDYSLTVKSWMDPAAEPEVSQGSAHSEMVLGGRVLHETVEGDMMGMPFNGIGYTGYNNTTGKYWSVWMDSMSTALGVGEGTWDAEAGGLAMTMEYVDPMTKTTKTARTLSRHRDDGTMVFEWFEDREGTEVKTMEIVYTPK